MTGYWLYRWRGITGEGEILEGHLLAAGKMSVRQDLISQDLQPLHVRTLAYLPASYWRDSQMMSFTSQLASLLEAGLPLRESLRLLADDHPRIGWRCLLRLLNAKIEQGHTLSMACADFPTVFSPLYSGLLALGELTGRLDRCCRLLAEHESRLGKLKKKVRGALRYPAFICLTAAAVLTLMLTLILPEFARLYEGINAPLPTPTRGLMALAAAVGDHGLTALLGAVLLYGGYRRICHYHPRWRQRAQAMLLYLPLIGRLVRHHNLHHLFQTLAITHQAGITLDNGLEMAVRTLTHPCYRRAVQLLQKHIRQGFALYQAFEGHRLFPSHCRQLIKTGEHSGTLDEVFQQLARLHEQQTHRLADGLAQLAEPLMLLIMGGLVCAMVIVLYLPLLQLGEVFGHF
ncbi:protein transport protein HofC [Sodalis sp. dw_96]|uniref:protein transport protein HofC n=1 Tax=Sodalis sp. dw_96 TaxID=2719794 RepID=UPI001BD558FB|nr:protein transport protein HofC [Sodalis sp. dw_96]